MSSKGRGTYEYTSIEHEDEILAKCMVSGSQRLTEMVSVICLHVFLHVFLHLLIHLFAFEVLQCCALLCVFKFCSTCWPWPSQVLSTFYGRQPQNHPQPFNGPGSQSDRRMITGYDSCGTESWDRVVTWSNLSFPVLDVAHCWPLSFYSVAFPLIRSLTQMSGWSIAVRAPTATWFGCCAPWLQLPSATFEVVRS